MHMAEECCCMEEQSETPGIGSRTLRPRDTSAPQNCCRSLRRITGGAVSHRNRPAWVEVSRLFLDHGTRVEVSRTTFSVSMCLEIGAEVSQSVLMPKCLVAEVSGNQGIDVSNQVKFKALLKQSFQRRLP